MSEISEKYLASRLGRTLEDLKKIYLSNKCICFLVCKEAEFIKAIKASSSIISNSVFLESDERLFPQKKEDGTGKKIFEKPTLFVHTAYMDPKELAKVIYPDLRKYIHLYSRLIDHEPYSIIYENIRDSFYLIIVNEAPSLPPDILEYASILEVPSMGKGEFNEYVKKIIFGLDGIKENDGSIATEFDEKFNDFLEKLYNVMRAMTPTQINNVLKLNKYKLGKLYAPDDLRHTEELIKNIRYEFNIIVSQSRALTIEEPGDEEPAAMDNLVGWIKNNSIRLKPRDEYNIEPGKGCLMVGLPGTGKSLMARYIASQLKMSLLKFDMGNVGGSFVGDSEKNMDNALSIIEKVSPCVLWIDEIEKAFAGSRAGSHETSIRTFGKFLTWLQDNKSSSFIFATANDISELPPEFFRSGRFDEKFYTFMPMAEECKAIFESILNNQNKKFSVGETELFEVNSLVKEFGKFLDGYCIKDGLDASSEDKVPRNNKFFIGSDIKKLIEDSKVLYKNIIDGNIVDHQYNVENKRGKYIYDTTLFIKCLKETVATLKTYGETNIKDIIISYSKFASYNFLSASSGGKDLESASSNNICLLPFDGYNGLEYINGSKNLLYSLERGEEHLKKLGSNYNKQLFLALRNALNKYAKIIFDKNKIN